MTTESVRLKTTVDQDRGPHSSGARYRQLTDVVTQFSDYSLFSWDSLDTQDREWWTDLLAELHEARVALAELPQEARSEVEERLLDEHCNIEDTASVIRRIIAEVSE